MSHGTHGEKARQDPKSVALFTKLSIQKILQSCLTSVWNLIIFDALTLEDLLDWHFPTFFHIFKNS